MARQTPIEELRRIEAIVAAYPQGIRIGDIEAELARHPSGQINRRTLQRRLHRLVEQKRLTTEGESVASIASHYGMGTQDLINANPQLQNPDQLHEGDIVHVPHKGSGEARTSVLSGQVEMMFDAVTTMTTHAKAGKVPIVRRQALRCRVPYALEGMVRRELEQAGATLETVLHGERVELAFSLPEDSAAPFVARVNELAHGRADWPGEAD